MSQIEHFEFPASKNVPEWQLYAFISHFVKPLEHEEWKMVLDVAKLIKIRKGDILFHAGDVCDKAYFVKSGLIRTYFNLDGVDVTFNFHYENSIATDFQSYLSQKSSTYSIQVIESGEVLEFNHEHVQQLYRTLKNGQELGRVIAENFYLLSHERITSLLFKSPEERYHELVNTNSPILQRVNLYHVASYLGVRPQSLSRIRKRLSTDLPH